LFLFGTYGTSVRSLVNPKIDEFSSRCLAGLNSCGISLLFCFIVPTSVNFFVFQLICKVNRHKEISCCYILPASVLTRNRLNQCANDITCQSMSYFILFFAHINFRIHHVFRGTVTHLPNFDSILAWFFRHILPESISSSEWK